MKKNAMIASSKSRIYKAFAVFMAIVLVVTLSPWGAFGTGDDTDSPADATVTTTPSQGGDDEQAAALAEDDESEAVNKVRLNLDLSEGNAYMVYTSDEEGKQTIAYPATYVDLPEGKDFTFQAKAANGYELEDVWFTIGQDADVIEPNADGTYTVPASKLANGRGIEIEVISAEAEDESTDGSDQNANTSDDAMLASEPAAVAETRTDITINVSFQDANGNATSVSSLGKSLYAFVYAGTINSVSQHIMVKLEQSDSNYTATLTGILGNNGNHYPLDATTDYHVILLATSNTYNENQDWDPNGENNGWWTVLKDSSLLKSLYTIDVPDSDIVKMGGTYTATATAFGAAASESLTSVLTGDMPNFGVITNKFIQDGYDAETNVAAINAMCTTQTGNDLTNVVEQTFILASVDNSFKIKGEPAYVYVPSQYASLVQGSGTTVTTDTSYTQEQLTAQVTAMLNAGKTSSNRLASVKDNAGIEKDKSDKAKWMVDLTSRGAGTYYITLDADTFAKVLGSADMLRIYKNDNQTIVFNVTASGSLNMNKFSVNGSGTDAYTNKSDTSSDTASSIVWNFISAQNITFKGAATGIFLAPKASITVDTTSSGWIVANQVTIGSGEWHNVYQYVKKLSDSTSLRAAKTVDNTDATVDGFKFQLWQQGANSDWQVVKTNVNGEEVEYVTNTGGTVQFGTITYNGSDFTEGQTEKTYVYKMTEVSDGGTTTIGGTSYTTDATVYYAKVTVTKSETTENNTKTIKYKSSKPVYYKTYSNGVLSDELGEGVVPTFSNSTIQKDSASVTIKGTKTVKGRNFQSGDSITFTLTGNGVQQTQTISPISGTSTSISFDPISYTESDLGGAASKDFTYTVTEKATMAGVSTDAKTQNVTVTLTKDSSGKLVATAKQVDGSSFTFTNTYNATGTAQLSATKTLTGRDWGNAESFNFKVEALNGAPGIEGDSATATATSSSKTATFAAMSYKLSDLDGKASKTFEYKITEIVPTGDTAGIDYDTSEYIAKVTVTDNGSGTLQTSVVYTKNGENVNSATFENKYSAKGEASLSATKQFNYENWGNGFTFSLTAADGTPMPEGASGTVTATATKDNPTASFGTINYTQAGTYTYTITEQKPNGATAENGYTVDGITYDASTYTARVVVTDNGKGTLETKVSYSSDGGTTWSTSVPEFKNSYEAVGSITLTGSKSLEGQTLNASNAGQFTYSVYEGSTKVATGTTNTDGTIAFKPITYTLNQKLNQTGEHTYIVKENIPEGATQPSEGLWKSGCYLYDGTNYTVTVNVTDNGSGKLDASVTSVKKGDTAVEGTAVSFANKYEADDSVSLSATKTLSGKSLEAGAFSFELKNASGTVLQTKSNNAEGLVTFDAIKYTKAGRYTYTITEVIPQGATTVNNVTKHNGVTYDTRTIDVTVVVTDLGGGKFEAVPTYSVSGTAIDAVEFANTYDASGQVALSGKKTLVNASDGNSAMSLEGKTFTFNVIDAQRAVVSTGTSDSAGNITFDKALSYKLEDLGGAASKDFTYTVQETSGTQAEGITFADSKTITVRVADDGSGTLSITVLDENGAAVTNVAELLSFTNEYRTTDAQATLQVSKSFTGRAWGDADSFTFDLAAVTEGAPMPAGTQATIDAADEDKMASFGTINYTKAGEYTYTITEQKPNGATAENNYTVDGITYDASTYTATVTVTEDTATGKLTAAVAYAKDGVAVENAVAAAFANTYTAKGSIALEGSKKLVADTESSDPVQLKLTDTYSFAVYDANGKEVATGTNDLNGKISFTAIEYGLDDLGDHKYTVQETSASTETVTIDTTVQTITVHVADNGDGTLTAKAVDGNGSEITDVASVLSFSNARKVEDTEATIQVQKALSGCDWDSIAKAGVSNFEFKLTAQNGAPMPTNSETAVAYASAANSTASFASITYAKAGTYNYTITEVVPEGATTVDGVTTYNGITYDTSQTTVTVTVENAVSEDGTTPTLVATVAYGPEGEQTTTVPVVTNTYKAAKATAELTASKTFTVNGAEAAVAEGQFKFSLTGEDGAPMPFGAEDNVLTMTNDASGNVAFGEVSYEKAGTYEYTIKEVTPTTGTTANADGTLTDAEGITYDNTTHTATVTVEDNGTGKLVATVVYDNDAAVTAPVFANNQFQAQANIVADKHLYGSSDGSFQFTLVSTDSSYTERTGALTHYSADAQIVDNGQQRFDVTVTNGAFSGSVAQVTLPTISYTEPGTYYYLLGEIAGEGSMAYDASTYQIAVTVAEDGSVATQYAVVAEGEDAVALSEGEVPAFYNNAAVLTTFRSMSLASLRSEDAGVSVMPEVTKVLKNGAEEVALEAGEFTFTLTGEGTELSATNDAAGNVAFATTDAITQEQSGALTFTEPGTYTYSIAEVDDGQEMITYDTSAIGLTVTVTADETGALQATTTYYNADGTVTTEPTFNNEQRSVDLRVQKTSKSDGEPLVGARYGLWIYNENGNDVYLGNATSGEDGYMTFTNVDVREGERYYFKEEAAPEGHLVNPYRDPYFYFVYNEETGNYDVYYEGTAEYEEQFPDAL